MTSAADDRYEGPDEPPLCEELYQCDLREDRSRVDPRELYDRDTDPLPGWPPWSKSGTAHTRPKPGQP